jgi:hypothetical protein
MLHETRTTPPMLPCGIRLSPRVAHVRINDRSGSHIAILPVGSNVEENVE